MAKNKVNTTKEEEKKKKKKLFIIFGSILGAGAIAGASVGIYFAVQPKAKPVKVDVPEINGLVFSNQKAYVGKDYDTEISVNKTLTTSLLPDELKSVKSGNRTIADTEYTYNLADNKETAQFHIPGKYIEGDVTIDLELVSPGPVVEYVDLNFVSESCSIKDKEGQEVSEVIKGELFEGKISLNEITEKHLPGDLAVIVGEKEVGVSDYQYDPSTGEFAIVPTDDVTIKAEADESCVSFLYKYSSDSDTVSFKTAPVVSSTQYRVDWGDESSVETYSEEHTLEHKYSELTEEGKMYEIKIFGSEIKIADDKSMDPPSVGFNQLVSMNFFNYSSGFVTPDFYNTTYDSLEKIYFGANFPSFNESRIDSALGFFKAPNLNSIIVHDDNPNISDLNSNLVANRLEDSNGNEYYSVQVGCNNSVLPENASIRRIGQSAFNYSNIEEINIPSSVEKIYSNPFVGCGKLEKITVDPDSEYFTSQDKNGKECNMVATLKISESHAAQFLIVGIPSSELPNDGTITQIDELAYGETPVEEINIPDKVTQINTMAFYRSYSLKRINISPNTSELLYFMVGDVGQVKVPRSGIFANFSQLEELIIPSNVQIIGSGAFLLHSSCTSITKITCMATVPPTCPDYTIWRDKPENLTAIYVPYGTAQTYKSSEYWSAASDIIQELPPVH